MIIELLISPVYYAQERTFWTKALHVQDHFVKQGTSLFDKYDSFVVPTHHLLCIEWQTYISNMKTCLISTFISNVIFI